MIKYSPLKKWFFPQGAFNQYDGPTIYDEVSAVMKKRSFWERPKYQGPIWESITKEKKK